MHALELEFSRYQYSLLSTGIVLSIDFICSEVIDKYSCLSLIKLQSIQHIILSCFHEICHSGLMHIQFLVSNFTVQV